MRLQFLLPLSSVGLPHKSIRYIFRTNERGFWHDPCEGCCRCGGGCNEKVIHVIESSRSNALHKIDAFLQFRFVVSSDRNIAAYHLLKAAFLTLENNTWRILRSVHEVADSSGVLLAESSLRANKGG